MAQPLPNNFDPFAARAMMAQQPQAARGVNFDPFALRDQANAQAQQKAYVAEVGPEYAGMKDRALSATYDNPLAAVTALAGNAMQAVPFSDEIGSGIAAALHLTPGENFKERYDNSQMSQQAMREAGMENNPGANITGSVGANLMTLAAPVGQVTKAKTLGEAAKAGAKVGAPMGAVYGAGMSDSSQSDSDAALGRGFNTAVGTGLGAAAGAAAPYLARGVEMAADVGAKGVQKLSDVIRGFQGKSPIAPAPVDDVTKLLAERVGQDMEAGGPSPQSMAAQIRKYKDQPITLMDVGGPNVQALSEYAAQSPGPGMAKASQFINERSATQPTRNSQILSDYIAPLDYLEKRMTTIDAMGSDAVTKGYKDVFRANPKVSGTQINKVLNDLDDSPLAQDIWDKARELAGYDKVKFNPRRSGNAVRDLSLQEIDYLKKAADDIVYSSPGSSGKSNISKGTVRFVKDWTRNLRGAADDATKGAYAEARARFGDPASEKAAMEEGLGFFTEKDFLDTLKKYAGRSDSEQQAYMSGVARKASEMMKVQGGDNPLAKGANDARNFANNATVRERLNYLLGEKQAAKMMDDLAQQGTMIDRGNEVLRNSSTARRQNVKEDIESRTMSGAEKFSKSALGRYLKNLNLGQPGTVVGMTTDEIGKTMSGSARDKLTDALASKLINTDYGTNQKLIYDINRAQKLSASEKKALADQIRRSIQNSDPVGRLLLRGGQSMQGAN